MDGHISTPRRELAPAIEEDEEPESESQGNGPAPLRQIENNISAILRGEVSIKYPGILLLSRRLFFFAFLQVSINLQVMISMVFFFGVSIHRNANAPAANWLPRWRP